MNASLSLRRIAARLPAPVRTRLGRFRAPITVDADAVDAWSTPEQLAIFLPLVQQRPKTPAGETGALPPCDLQCLLITDALDTGGLDEVVAFLARQLPRQGFRVAVLHAQDSAAPLGRLGQKLAAEGIEVVALPESEGVAWIRSWRPDVVSAHGAPEWAIRAARNHGAAVVETLHGMHDFVDSDLLQRRAELLDTVVAVSDLVRTQYLAACPSFDSSRVLTIPNGVDPDRLVELPRQAARAALGLSEDFLFVSLSRHSLQKNTYGLVSAFLEVAEHHSEAQLLIAGRPEPGDYPTQVRRLQRSSPYGARVRLMDAVTAPAALLAAADAFVLDSFFEGWALSSMEAMATGLPVIVSEVGGAAEQVAGRPDRGILVPNPAGDPARVDWPTMSNFRYRRQPNRSAVIEAMTTLIRQGPRPDVERVTAGRAAASDFSSERCLSAHAAVLRARADRHSV